MATGSIATTIAAVLDLDDSGFNEKMEAKPAQAERYLSQVAESAHRNLSQVGDAARNAMDTLSGASASAGNAARESMRQFVRDASQNFTTLRDHAQDSFSEISSLAMRYLSFGALAGTMMKNIGKFFIQEDAVEGLRSSLRGLGKDSDEAMLKYQAFASEIQAKTKFGDETVLGAMSQGIRLGLDPKNIEDVTNAAVGLTEKLKVDLSTAMMLVARAAQGNTTMLSRHGLKIDETLSKEEKFQEVLRQGKAAFGLAEDAAKTTSGQFAQMNNSLGDVMEDIGKFIAEILRPLVQNINKAADAFHNLAKTSPALQKLIIGLGAVATGMTAFRIVGGGTIGMVTRLIPMLAGMGTAAAGAGAAAGGAATGFTVFWAAAAGPIAVVLAGFVALKATLDKVDGYYDEVIAKAKDIQGQAQEMRTKLQGENAERTAAIKRLQEMTRIGHLNNATQDDANRLIEKYGFNMKVVNGQLVNMGDSFDMLIKKQEELGKRQLEFSYKRQLAAIDDEIDALEQKAKGFSWGSLKQGLLSLPAGMAYGFGKVTGLSKLLGVESLEELAKVGPKSSEIEAFEKAVKKRGDLVKEMQEALSDSGKAASDAVEKQGEAAGKATRPALEALKKQREEYRLAAMDARELKRELTAQRETLRDQISQHESLDDYTDEELGKLKEMEEIHNRILGIYEESEKYIQKQNDDLKAYNRERSRELASRQFDKEFDRRLSGAKTREDDQKVLDVTNKRVAVAKRKAQQALAWYNRQLEIANDDEIITDKEKEQLDKRLQNLKDADALVEKETERREKAIEAIESRAAERQEKAIEAIESRAAKRQEERNRRRSEALQRQAAQISRRLGMIGMGNLDRGGFAFDRNGRFRGNVGAGALARFSRRRDSMAETRAKIEAMNAGQRTYIDAAGRERRVHFSLQDKRNMFEVEKLEERRRRLEERAKDYTKPIEEVKGAVEKLGENCLIVKR